MVDKNLGLVDDLIFADVHESYPDSEMEGIYDEFFVEGDFDGADLLVLTGGPDELEEGQRRESLVQYLEEFDGESLPVLLTTPSQKKKLDEDERVSDDDYIFHRMQPESSVDEVKAIKQELSDEENFAVFTNDYHVPRYEKLLESVDESNDYLVFGREFEPDEFMYRDKWNSEAFRTFLPQKIKDLGKKYLR